MAKKYFVISDIHSFYIQMKNALFEAGFRKKNKDHILIVIGDAFDRGPDAIKTYEYLRSIPKSRRIMIRGNHEDLYEELLKKDFPQKHDESNGTLDTFAQLSNMPYYSIYDGKWFEMRRRVRNHEITKWIKSNEWKNYYELGPYIFTHSFIPTKIKEEYERILDFYTPLDLKASAFEFYPDWRNASAKDWYWSRWGCPFTQYEAGLFKGEEDEGKILVVGHWHTSAFYEYLKHDHRYYDECAPIYFSRHLIGIDGGVVRNTTVCDGKFMHPQNVLVIDGETWKAYDKFGNELEEEESHIYRETVSYSDLTEEEKQEIERTNKVD